MQAPGQDHAKDDVHRRCDGSHEQRGAGLDVSSRCYKRRPDARDIKAEQVNGTDTIRKYLVTFQGGFESNCVMACTIGG
jgi:hypothetical protein